ncbi:HAD family hydrolase [Nonomuraea mangrovi]|uniref:HAD family hydrolase n=1 Tax=Nonomuraea mangrovi TaxID=2316207 RepID=A0ABW4TD71_9ACTN
MPSLVRCFPGVLEGLAELRADGWRVGVVTNGAADNQVGKLERTGLMDALDGYAVSGAEGIRKPEAGLFEIAARRCGVSMAGGGWMVGDNLVADVGGGRAAGLRTVWVGGPSGRGCEADHVATDAVAAMATIRRG